MLSGKGEAAPVSLAEQLGLSVMTAAPDRSDGMDDIFRGQAEAGRDPRFTRRAAADFPAGFQKLRSCCSVNCSVHSAAAE